MADGVSGPQANRPATPVVNTERADASSGRSPSSGRQVGPGISGWEVSRREVGDFARVSTLVNHIMDPNSSLAHRADDFGVLDKLCENTKYDSVRKECYRLRPMLNPALQSQYKNGLLTKDEILTIDPSALAD